MSDPIPGKRVIVVEDDHAVRDLLSEIPSGGGYDCRPAESALRALSLLAEDDDVDMILSDIHMHGIDGTEFLRSVKALLPTPVRPPVP